MVEPEPSVETWCPICEEAVLQEALHTCMICRRLVCHRCAVRDFGRIFCTHHCRDVFFFGDDEEPDEGLEGGE